MPTSSMPASSKSSRSKTDDKPTDAPDYVPALNLAVLLGTLSSDPVQRSLPSGDTLVQFEVTVRADDNTTTSTPVVLFGKPRTRPGKAGDRVVVVGSVRRRFYRAGGSTQSRTEVVAEKVTVAPTHRSLRSGHRSATEVLETLVIEQ